MHTGKGRKRWLVWLALGSLLAFLTAFLQAVWPREHLLLERAKKIVQTTGWQLDRGTTDPQKALLPVGGTYQWLDDHRVFFFRNLDKPSVVYWAGGVTWTPDTGGIPTFYDLLTGREHCLAGLAVPFGKTDGEASDAQVSPDGKWLLWTSGEGNRNYVATLQGKHVLEWDRSDYAYWTPDSRNLIEIGTSPKNTMLKASMHSLANVRQVKTMLFADPSHYAPLRTSAINPEGCLLTSDWAPDRAEWLLTNLLSARPGESTQLNLFCIAPGRHAPVRTFPISLPPHAHINALVFSPRGDQAAWVLTRSQVSSLAQYLHRWLPGYKVHPRLVTELWVGRVDGSGLHEIGYVENHFGLNKVPPVDYVRWLPDGKQLSFVYKDALWTVPAD